MPVLSLRPINSFLTQALAAIIVCGSHGAWATETSDPIEPVNRPIERFNDDVDDNIFKPLADGYVAVTPEFMRHRVSNFFSNIGYVNVIVNGFLQGKFAQGFSDTGRFLVNSTIGVAGIFDPASSMGLEQHDEDFGQTLGVWGSGAGPYLVLPVLGPNSVRDTPGLAVKAVTNVLFYISSAAITIPLGVLGALDRRASADTAISIRNESALDRYIFTREAYLQHRDFLIYDGNPPVDDTLFDDEDEFSIDESPKHATDDNYAFSSYPGVFRPRGMGLRPIN